MIEVIASSTEALYDDYADLKLQTSSGYATYGLAGIVVNDCVAVICGNCATDEDCDAFCTWNHEVARDLTDHDWTASDPVVFDKLEM